MWLKHQKSEPRSRPASPLNSKLIYPAKEQTSQKISSLWPVECCFPRLTSINWKCLSYNSIHRKSLSYNSIHQMHGEMLVILFPYNFKKSLKKIRTSFCLNQIKQSGDGWKKICLFFFGEKMVIMQVPYMKIVWLAFFDGDNKNFSKYHWNCPNFFLNRKMNFVLKQTFSKKFCMQNLIFCLHNIVLDTQQLNFFRFSG